MRAAKRKERKKEEDRSIFGWLSDNGPHDKDPLPFILYRIPINTPTQTNPILAQHNTSTLGQNQKRLLSLSLLLCYRSFISCSFSSPFLRVTGERRSEKEIYSKFELEKTCHIRTWVTEKVLWCDPSGSALVVLFQVLSGVPLLCSFSLTLSISVSVFPPFPPLSLLSLFLFLLML